jgi:hypothetical protein
MQGVPRISFSVNGCLQPSLEAPQIGTIVASFGGIVLLAVLAAVLARSVMVIAFHWTAKVPEIILVAAVSWCFAVVLLGASLDTITEREVLP